MTKWCPHLNEYIEITEFLYSYLTPFRCVCGRLVGQTIFTVSGLRQGVNEEMPKVNRPASKAGLFLKAANIKGNEITLKVKAVRVDQDLPAGKATILDFDYDGKTWGFPLNVTNHRALCELYGDPKAETFDTKDVEDKSVTLYKVVVNNPQTGREGESLRIRVKR